MAKKQTASDIGLKKRTDGSKRIKSALDGQLPGNVLPGRKNDSVPVDVMVIFNENFSVVSPAEIRLVHSHLDELLLNILSDVSYQEDEQ